MIILKIKEEEWQGERLEPAPFNNKIVYVGLDGEGRIFASDSEGNHFCWCPCPENCGYVWGLTLEQKVKMDGLDSVTKWEQKEYMRERAQKAIDKRWSKQREEDSKRRGIKNRKVTLEKLIEV